MKVTVLFPGQGSQKVGMGADFNSEVESAKNKFAEANDIMGRDIAALCFNGPEEDLKATRNTQPALFTVEAVIFDALVEKGIVPVFTAGHSLGEYSALYAAGVYSFSDGLKIVAHRGSLMANAGEKKPGTMAAVIGLAGEQIRKVLSSIENGIVVPANQNSIEQTVISGEIEAVNRACDLLKEAGAKRAIPLPVSGAFHSPLMQEAADEFKEFLEGFEFSKPKCPVISNVTARAETEPRKLKELLVRQFVSPVRWVEIAQFLAANGGTSCIEAGPGSVLKELIRKCDVDVNVISCGTVEKVYSLEL